MTDTQPSLLTWHAAPTTSGPRTAASDGERTRATSRERWDAWANEHADKLPAVLAEARRRVDVAYAAGIKPRVGAKALGEWISATAGLGEWLAEHEDLRPYVERRGVK